MQLLKVELSDRRIRRTLLEEITESTPSVCTQPSQLSFFSGQPGTWLSKLSKVSNDPGGEKERQKHQFCSLWEGCSSSMFCVGYRPSFETWVRIRHFAGLSIPQRAGPSSSNLWGSKVLAKSLQTAFRGPPASIRRPATRKPALAGFSGFLAARSTSEWLPSYSQATPSHSQAIPSSRRPTNRFLVARHFEWLAGHS